MGLKENLDVIKKIFPLIKNYKWVLIGSTNLALQGIEVEAKDIDLLTNEKNAYLIGEALEKYAIETVHFKHTDIFDSHYGKFIIDGIELEIIGDTNESDKDIDKYGINIKIDTYNISACSLKRELEAYIKLGRTEKAGLIRRFLEDKP